MGSRIVNSLWLIEVDPHRGGSISLRPILAIKERFNLQLEPEEIDQMKSIGRITTLLVRRPEQD
jgi:hypothetical protein